MTEMPVKRGRPAKITKETEVSSKKEMVVKCRTGASTTTYKYDHNIAPYPYQADIKYHELTPKPEIIKNQKYHKLPIVMVFKTSKYKDARTKIKTWHNTNIDWIISQDHLPGIPERAVILEIAMGESYIKKYKEKYNIK